MSKKYYIITDSDLDGICSYLTLCWFLTGKPNIPYTLTTVTKFRADIENWLKNDDLKKYDKVFITDMDIANHASLIDYPNVVVIDHHKTHVPRNNNYTQAKCIIKEFTSCTRLIYQQFSKLKELSKEQKILVALADDYDCYKLAIPDSYNLHVVYYQTQNSVDKTKAEKFIENFGGGFKGFTEQQTNLIRLHRKAIDKVIEDLNIFGGTIRISGQDMEVRSTVADKAINEVADYLIRQKGADVAIVVNPNSGHVSFRRGPTEKKIDVSKIAEKFTDGGGHEYAAGGQVNELFLEFTKMLRPLN